MDPDVVEIKSFIHLSLWSVHVGIEALKSLFDGEEEDDVDEYDAVVGDQEKHLEALRPTIVGTVSCLIHLLH